MKEEKLSTYTIETLSQVKSERSKARQTLQRRINRESEKGRTKLKEETKTEEKQGLKEMVKNQKLEKSQDGKTLKSFRFSTEFNFTSNGQLVTIFSELDNDPKID